MENLVLVATQDRKVLDLKYQVRLYIKREDQLAFRQVLNTAKNIGLKRVRFGTAPVKGYKWSEEIMFSYFFDANEVEQLQFKNCLGRHACKISQTREWSDDFLNDTETYPTFEISELL